MNMLTDGLPETVVIDNVEYKINTDFRAAVQFELMLENGVENAYELLQPFFPDGLPQNILGAFKAILKHYACGEDIQQEQDSEKKTNKKPKAYSYDKDADTIYADFFRYYNIDLTNIKLHWWTFRALLLGLCQDSGFKQNIYYRTCDTKGMSKAEKERVLKIRKAIALDDKNGNKKMTLEERNRQMRNYVLKQTNETN